jgi:hypothetical protein
MATTRISARWLGLGALVVAALGGAAFLMSPVGTGEAQQQETTTYAPYESQQLFSFPGEWDTVKPEVVRAIYPGQASWQFVSGEDHLGSEKALSGTSCASCHGNAMVEQSSVAGWAGPPPVNHREGTGCAACHSVLQQRIGDMGQSLVNHPVLDLNPIAGKLPYVDVSVQAAYDSEFIYMRFAWDAAEPGVKHDLHQWDGERWIRPSTAKPNPDIPSYEDRLTLLIDDRNLPAYDGAKVGFGTMGCWQTCHRSMREMQGEPSRAEVEAHPYLGETRGESDVRKYLLSTRTGLDETGGWDKVKSPEELEALMEAGDFLDMIMWRASRGGPLGYADDGHVFEYRNSDAGRSAFRTVGPGELMFNEEETGYRALTEAQLLAQPDLYLLHEDDAVAVTEDVEFEPGALLPRRLLRDPDPEASRGDVLMNSRWEEGRWTLEMRRRLDTGHADDKALEPGRVYNIGIAIFDDNVSNRRHQISEVVTLGIGTPADIVAVPLEAQTEGN